MVMGLFVRDWYENKRNRKLYKLIILRYFVNKQNYEVIKMKIKVPVKDIEKEDILDKVKNALEHDSENAYTVSGLMVEVFGVKQKDIHNKPFSAWKKGLPALYGRIDRCLRKLNERGIIERRKHGKAWVYWYVGAKK